VIPLKCRKNRIVLKNCFDWDWHKPTANKVP
jgi:hypothetical protein